MLHDYEIISGKDSGPQETLIEAIDIIENGWTRRNYPVIDVVGDIRWQLSDQSERSWNFYIHSWDMLDTLLKAYSYHRYRILLQPAVDIATDWISRYVDVKTGQKNDLKLDELAWYDMAVGLRAYRLAFILDAYQQNEKLNNKDIEHTLWQGLLAHQSYLADDNNIVFHNNHGYYQAAGQIAMGRRFQSQSDVMTQAFTQGNQRFEQMLNQQFTEQGVHKEHSPDYHRMVYTTLLGVIGSGIVTDPYIIEFTRRVEKTLSWFIKPDGYIANFGDSDHRSMRLGNSRAAKEVWNLPAMQFATTDGEVGYLSDENIKVYKDAGYFIVRQNTNSSKRYRDYSYLAQTAAFHSRTHKHADDLSFVWYDRGHNILIDAGRYGYIGKTEMSSELWQQGYWYSDPNRLYCESTRAHNTLEFDDLDYPRKGVKAYGSAIGRHRQYDTGLTVLETECKHFDSIRRARVLIYMPGQWLIVFDWFKDNLDKTHDVKQWFNFAPEVDVQLNDDHSYLAHLNKDTTLHITPLLPNMQASEVVKGQTEPRLQGWYSPAEREMIPVCSINYALSAQNTASMATLFTFGGLPKVAFDTNKANVSGRSIILTWQDDLTHTIALNRPAEGDISTHYQIKT